MAIAPIASVTVSAIGSQVTACGIARRRPAIIAKPWRKLKEKGDPDRIVLFLRPVLHAAADPPKLAV